VGFEKAFGYFSGRTNQIAPVRGSLFALAGVIGDEYQFYIFGIDFFQ
jgi:hypothetical protein